MSGTIAPVAPAEPRNLTWQKLILGDWSRWVRDPLDVMRIAFAGATIGWALAGEPATQVIAATLVLLLARAVSLPRFYDFSLIVVMFLLAWGEVVGLYDTWSSYDNVVHFTVPLLTSGMVYLLLMRLDVLPELSGLTQPHHRVGFFVTTLCLGMAIGACWEIVEFTLDATTSSQLQISVHDTSTDLIFDTLGAMGSATILLAWSLGGHSLRRRPGAALAHKPFGSFLTLHAHSELSAGRSAARSDRCAPPGCPSSRRQSLPAPTPGRRPRRRQFDENANARILRC